MQFSSNFSMAKNAWRVIAGLLVALALSACAGPTTMHTEVRRYNDWAAAPADKTYVFARSLEDQSSLEMQSYEALVRDELSKLGFREVSDTAASAHLQVRLRPMLAVRHLYDRNPFFFENNWRFRDWYGSGFYRHGYPGPFAYGYFPFDDQPLYVRQLHIEIDRVGTPPLKRLYEATAQVEDWDNSLSRAMPYLVRAIFSDFPGNNGETRQVDLVVDRK